MQQLTPIFKPVPVELTDDWMPDQLLVRDDDVRHVIEELRKWGNVYLYGKRGVGKSLVAKHVLQYVLPEQRLYVKCKGSLSYSVRASLSVRGFNTNKDLPTIIGKDMPSPVLAVFDDVHLIYHKTRDLFFFKFLYDEAPDGHVRTLICSTMPFHIFRKLCPEEVMSRCQWRNINFGTYNPNQLTTILKQRADRVFQNVQDGAVKWIAAKIVRLEDTRLGIRVLRACYETGITDLTLDAVKKGWDIEKNRYWKDDIMLTAMGSHTALLFYLISSLTLKHWTDHPDSYHKRVVIMSDALYRWYREACEAFEVTPLYDAKLLYYLKQLEKDSYLQLTKKSYGRDGMKTHIRLLFDDPKAIVEAGDQIDWRIVLT